MPLKRPVKSAATSVGSAAAFYHYLGQKIEKWGIRITVVQMFPKPIIDITIKDKE